MLVSSTHAALQHLPRPRRPALFLFPGAHMRRLTPWAQHSSASKQLHGTLSDRRSKVGVEEIVICLYGVWMSVGVVREERTSRHAVVGVGEGRSG